MYKCSECGMFSGCKYCHELQLDVDAEVHDLKPSGII